MSARQQCYKRLIYNVMLAKYHAAYVFLNGGHPLAKRFNFGNKPGGRFASAGGGFYRGLNIGHVDPLK